MVCHKLIATQSWSQGRCCRQKQYSNKKNNIFKFKTKSTSILKFLEKVQESTLYDGFNVILRKMTDELIKCGASPKIKTCVHQLWAAYLFKIEVVKRRKETEPKSVAVKEPSIIPEWYPVSHPITPEVRQDESEASASKDLLFAPEKV